ncbi:hypothetical protein AHiyo6_24230 [Arthrobacter sp. Hiyo6]|jgi:hypothetical protein|nr:hypothetical protein AHiyo6_24230 [Arthrobacter sp. Hiyo6]
MPDQRQSLGFERSHAPKAVSEESTAIEDLRGAARSGVEHGNFTLPYLWVSFWSHGGHAGLAEMTSFFQGLQDLPDNDALVLVSVLDELQDQKWTSA